MLYEDKAIGGEHPEIHFDKHYQEWEKPIVVAVLVLRCWAHRIDIKGK